MYEDRNSLVLKNMSNLSLELLVRRLKYPVERRRTWNRTRSARQRPVSCRKAFENVLWWARTGFQNPLLERRVFISQWTEIRYPARCPIQRTPICKWYRIRIAHGLDTALRILLHCQPEPAPSVSWIFAWSGFQFKGVERKYFQFLFAADEIL